MHVLVATDAFDPLVNGVVRSLDALASTAPALGSSVSFLEPRAFRTLPMPTYPEIRLALVRGSAVGDRLDTLRRAGNPVDHIHIATEGPIGLSVRRFCLHYGLPFTTSYHTQFPDYVAARFPIPRSVTYALLRRFHNAGSGIMVSTPTLANDLGSRGFMRLMRWSRGVDLGLFNPAKRAPWELPRPIFLYAGRVAPEKNLRDFLALDLPGSKVVIGDGPSLASLRQTYPTAHFLGVKKGDDLAKSFASADAFVFPSRTDTFGMVLLEAMASGLPVAAFPVAGPLDVVGTSGAGVLDADLREACLAALAIPPETARRHAESFTWMEATRQFLDNVDAAQASHVGDRSEPSSKQRKFLG